MVMFIQAFRFAYEPFIFSQAKEQGASKLKAYSDAMKYFVLFALMLFMGVMFYLDILKYFIAPSYFSGLKVVPVIMMAELFFGIFYNLSLWYKLTDRTIWGMWFSLFGLAVTVTLNVILVPRIGYMGCAFAALCSYGLMMIASYIIGRRKYPINYQTGRIASYFAIAAVCYVIGMYCLPDSRPVEYIVRFFILSFFAWIVIRRENILLRPFLKKFLGR
mgnify:FL=1